MGNDNSKSKGNEGSSGGEIFNTPTAAGGLAKKIDFVIHVVVKDETYDISVPDVYKTNGWLLREATQLHLAQFEDPHLVALQRADGNFVDLSGEVVNCFDNGDTLTAVDNKQEGVWDPDGQSISKTNTRDLVGYHDQEVFTPVTDFEVTVCVGDETEYIVCLPSLELTVGWVLSEAIRRYMHENDEMDPGILGLRTMNGVDLDLSEEIVNVVNSGESLLAVTYTVARSASNRAQQQAPSPGGSIAAFARRLSRGSPSPSSDRRLSPHSSPRASPRGSSRRSASGGGGSGSGYAFMDLDRNGVPILQEAGRLSALRRSFRDSIGAFAAVSSDEDSPVHSPMSSAAGRKKFLPLKELIKQIGLAEAREETEIMASRHMSADRPASVVSFSVQVSTDPSGTLPRYATMVVDSVRLCILDSVTNDLLINWRYEEIQGWVVGVGTFGIKAVKDWGVQLFEFETSRGAMISKTLLERVNALIATRKHQKQQSLVQAQRETARKIKASAAARKAEGGHLEEEEEESGAAAAVVAEGGEEVVRGEGESKEEAAMSEGVVEEAEEEDIVSVRVERQIDPSGILARHLLLHFQASQLVVCDVTTKDVLFEWPYVMVYAWGVTERTFVAAISVAPPSNEPATAKKMHYNTYAFKTMAEDDDKIQALMREMMDRITDGDDAQTEVSIPQTMSERRMQATLTREYKRVKNSSGSCYQSNTGNEQIYTFEGAQLMEDDDSGGVLDAL